MNNIPNVLDNPNDIAIREEQRRVRVEQGQALIKKTEEEQNQPAREYSEPFLFRFRQVKSGPFGGLWELAVMKPNGKIDEMVTDADALPNVLALLENIFINRGF